MKKVAGGFMEFVRKQGVVGLAVGLAIGTQVTVFIKDIVASIIDPLIGLILGNADGLKAMVWSVHVGDRAATFKLGQVAYSFLVFLAVCAVVYFVVMGLKLDKLDAKKDK